MEMLEYNVLRQKAAYNAPTTLLQPSVEEMQQWVTDLKDRRRSLQLESSEHCGASFRELEQRYHLQDVWGHNTTPAMQTLECIQKVKQALLVEGAAEESISVGAFSLLVALSMVAAVAIVLVWELHLRPRGGHGDVPLA